MDPDTEQYNLETTEYICAHHIDDDFIRDTILKTRERKKCDYCGQLRIVAPLSEVLKLIIVGIEYEYEDPNNSRFHNKDGEHGFDGQTIDFYDLYYGDELGLRLDNEKLIADVYRYLSNDQIYCRKDEFGGHFDYLDGLWKYFKEIVKHKARFVFHFKRPFSHYLYSKPSDILDNVQRLLIELNLFRKISTKTKLHRCVQHALKTEVKKDGKRIAANPNFNCKTNNRMSPAGISMFYSSLHKDVAISEVVDPGNSTNPFYTVAYFRPKSRLKVIDLTNLPPIPSIYDKDQNRFREPLFFLRQFIDDITQPSQPGDEILDYIPTQIVTEYIKFNPKLAVDGIMYPSSKVAGKENLVLFLNHDDSMEKLIFYYSSKRTFHI
jgi:hypothetical protein